MDEIMKKSVYLFCTLLLILIACKKEEYIKHDSQIFLNDNAKIIGTWHYLFSISGGGFVGVDLKTFQDLPDLKIDPYGVYEKFKGSNILSRGVIDTIKTIQNVIYVKFYPNGIKTSIEESPSLMTINSDTLRIFTASGDRYKSEYYKRN
jgi:hypothetical protein